MSLEIELPFGSISRILKLSVFKVSKFLLTFRLLNLTNAWLISRLLDCKYKLQALMVLADVYLVMRMTSKRYINVKTPRVMPWSREAPVPLPRKKREKNIVWNL